MFSRGLVALTFFIFIIVIIFMMFQIQDNSNRCKDSRLKHQDMVTRAARLLVQSATQMHPMLANEHAIEAKIIIDQVIDDHGGVTVAEKDLKLPKGRLESLRAQIMDRYRDVQDFLMERVIQVQPELDVDINEDAGLRKRKPTSSKKKKRHVHQSDL